MIILSIKEKGILGSKEATRTNGKNNIERLPTTVVRRINISDDAVKYFISAESCPRICKKNDFKHLKAKGRIEAHLALIAEGNPFEWEEIRE